MRRIARRILHQDDPPSRIARGVSAGFFAAAFPLPGLQIPLSLLLAFAVRGNRVVSIFPQFISNAGTMLPLAYLQYHLGAVLWPSRAAHAHEALDRLREAAEAWSWSQPLTSCGTVFSGLGSLGWDAMGPLLVGVLITGALLAFLAYPLTVIGVWFWRQRRLAQRRARGWVPRRPVPLELHALSEAVLTPDAAIARYAFFPERFLKAQAVKLLVDGREAYPEMLAAIEAARASVYLETYILRADRTGRRFAEALSEAALRGVRVRLLYDAVGGFGLSEEFLEGLRLAGVEVGVYHPLLWRRPFWALNRRDHRKILIVDRRTAFTGGLNIADEYAAREDGGGGWRDTHLRVEGAMVSAALERLFEYGWRRSRPAVGGRQTRRERLSVRITRLVREYGKFPAVLFASARAHPPPGEDDEGRAAGAISVQVLGNREFRNRRAIRRAYLHAIHNAERYILIENAFFTPDRGIRRALTHALRRGVQVAVAVGQGSGVPIAAASGRALYSELLYSGVRIFEWKERMLHAKTAVVDDAWAVVGTYNMNHRSLFHDLEDVVVIVDPAFARRLREQTLADIANCHELTREEHESRSWREILVESVAYQLRYWM